MAKKSGVFTGERLEKLKEAAGLATLLGALFVLVGLITYDPADMAYGAWPPNPYVYNKGGRLGAALAEFLYRHLGLASFAAVAVAGAWGTATFFRHAIHSLAVKAVAAVVAIYAAAVLLSLQPVLAAKDLGLASVMPSLGGFYGEAGRRMLTRALGAWGTFLLVIFLLGASLMLATEWRPHQVALAVWRGLVAAGRWAGTRVWPKVAGLVAAALMRARSGAPAAAAPLPASRPAPDAVATKPSPVPFRASAAAAPRHPEKPTDAARPEPPPEAEAPRSAPRMPVVVLPPPSAPAAPPGPRPVARPREAAPRPRAGAVKLPPVELFEDARERNPLAEEIDTQGTAEIIEKTLAQFQIAVRVTSCQRGPIITAYYIEPAPGVKVSKIHGMHDELGLALRTPSVRIVGPIPGKGVLGIEVPNPCPEIVRMRSLINQSAEAWSRMPLPLLLGKDSAGTPLVRSLTEMPHMLVAGTTGSGKSVCINTIITSLLITTPPSHLKLILVDPKMVELSGYKGIPHLWAPVLTDLKREVPTVMEWLCREMDERYDLLSAVEVKNVAAFNQLTTEEIRQRLARTERPIPDPLPDHLPYVVLVIDEFAELMNVASKEVTVFVQRLAQKARAVGIHVVIATQHPSTTVVSPEIKANFPARVAFQVSSQVNSRVVLDRNGAERLLGRGDMLMLLPGMSEPIRGQGTYLPDKEVQSVVDFLRAQGKPDYHAELMEATSPETAGLDDEPIDDRLYEDAVRVILTAQRGSVSLLQRKLGVGYSRAARLVDMMADKGVVGGYQGSKAREVLLTLEQWEGLKAGTPVEEEAAAGA